MASDSRDTAGGPRRRKAKGTTIDLTATEVRRKAPPHAEATETPGVDGADPAVVDQGTEDETLFTDGRPEETSGTGSDPVAGDPVADPVLADAVPPADEPVPSAGADPVPSPADPAALSSPDVPDASATETGTGTPVETADEAVASTAISGEAPSETTPQIDTDPDRIDETVAEPSTTEPVEDRKRSAFGSSLIAAAVGGLIVLAGGAALFAGGLLAPDTDGDAIARLEDRMTDLDTRIEGFAAEGSTELSDRLAAVETAVAGAGSDDLAGTVDALRSRIDELSAAPAAGGDTADLTGRIDEIAASVEALRSEVAAGAGDDLAGRIDGIAADVTSLSERVDGLVTTAEQLQAAIDGLTRDLGAGSETVAALDARVGDIERRLDEGPKDGEIAALSLAVTSLASRVAAGEPFEADLALVRSAATDVEGVDALGADAAAGLPTVDALAAAFPADAILAARIPSEDTGVVDRLFDGAKALVNYRETGPDAADPVAAAVAEARDALAAGNLEGARAALDGLSGPPRDAAAAFMADLDRRIAADRVVAALTDRILTRLQAPAAGQ